MKLLHLKRPFINLTWFFPALIITSLVCMYYLVTVDDADSVVNSSSRRLVFIDCGANMGQSVQLVRETFPQGLDYEIFSFELDPGNRPFFDGFDRHHLFCPMAVSTKNGTLTAYLEGHFTGKRMGYHWGGGVIASNEGVRNLREDRHLVKTTVPTIDLSDWILRSFTSRDYVVLKLDVEGAEYDILQHLLKSRAHTLIDKWYGEYHDKPRFKYLGHSMEDWRRLKQTVSDRGINFLSWSGEDFLYGDMDEVHPPLGTKSPGELLSSCPRNGAAGKKAVSLVIAVDTDPIKADRLVKMIRSFFTQLNVSEKNGKSKKLPVTLFVYSDFVVSNPGLVTEWAKSFEIGTRGQRDFHGRLPHHEAFLRKSLVAASLVFKRRQLEFSTLLAQAWDGPKHLLDQSKLRGLSVIRPSVSFPPMYKESLQVKKEYYEVIMPLRIPIALSYIDDGLKASSGGILGLDAAFEPLQEVIVFLLQYLTSVEGPFALTRLHECLKSG